MNTNKTNILLVIIALLVGGIGGYILNELRYSTTNMSAGMYSSDTASGIHRMPGGSLMHDDDMMMGHMDMMVTSERAFIEGMIPHHQEAIDTAKEVLERGGTTAEMRALAGEIIVAQEAEIAEMKRWYEDWYGTSYEDAGEYNPMMRDLSKLSGRELDRTFLEDMVMHHMGAIMMARSVQPYIEHQEITDLTKAVIETQSSEIRQMQNMLQSL